MPKDMTRVDHESLRAAKMKYRQVVVQLEEGTRSHSDILHPVYKLGEFLSEALGPAWTAADDRAPDSLPNDIYRERPT